jgi:hypothetical protein
LFRFEVFLNPPLQAEHQPSETGIIIRPANQFSVYDCYRQIGHLPVLFAYQSGVKMIARV